MAKEVIPAQLLKGIGKKVNDNEFTVKRENIVKACKALNNGGFEHLTLITAVDWQDKWEIVYHITKFGRKDVVVLKVTLPYNDPKIHSIEKIWIGAGWHERETYDLMGIKFTGNKDLRRILLPEDYEEFPLRKEVLYGNRS
ncbi:MAG: NADH-quinone oxidoreductase subunit C [Candidatus Woesearchaeota archaeon]|nr:NADH-quinone oxidoreductase subunit C [Candidatus Woesearchaeota archaeon]